MYKLIIIIFILNILLTKSINNHTKLYHYYLSYTKNNISMINDNHIIIQKNNLIFIFNEELILL